MLSEELERTLNQAFKAAREKRHEFMTVEHLLLALLDNPASNSALRACGANIDTLEKDLVEFLDETTPLLPDEEDREKLGQRGAAPGFQHGEHDSRHPGHDFGPL